VARRLLGSRSRFGRPRLGYREVASSTNRMTLIAAIIPAGCVTTHTIFCMREPPVESLHWFLCGVFNSFVANYLVRMRVGLHVTVSIIERLPVPVLALDDPMFVAIADLATRLALPGPDPRAGAALQARVARLYGLSPGEFRHVLATFPLVSAEEREAAEVAFTVQC
jgi:hypothetical protein